MRTKEAESKVTMR